MFDLVAASGAAQQLKNSLEVFSGALQFFLQPVLLFLGPVELLSLWSSSCRQRAQLFSGSTLTVHSIMVLSRVSKDFDDQIPKFQSRQNIQSQSSLQRDDFQILLNCAKRQFVSCTSNLLEQMYGLPKMHNLPPEVDFESSRSAAKS